ncbi:iron-containing alcohol dehydrogenase [Bacillus piscicola]|uniref:iron-containing alcohol dehydrogenase n=1 Tax=Bacillus piscicola TaxID=1632684 RepID=UPI001F0917BD|nr:iron-containing alcohol dehydrogenase [Bacillus piscicola]
MKTNSLRIPDAVYYGDNSIEKLGEEAAKLGQSALLISDKPMQSLGYVTDVSKRLKEAGVISVPYTGVDSETKDTHVNEALALLRQHNCDLIIALGGGSCIDAAKATAVLANNESDLMEYVGNKKEIARTPLPVIAIPTTAGTGSEVTDAFVVTNTKKDIKMMIKQPVIMPNVAIVDPAFTMSAPKGLTAATGIDALCHAIEAYLSKLSHPISDVLALDAIQAITANIKRVYEDGSDRTAREKMAQASMQAGIAFSNSSVCLVHGMSRPIGALYHVPHGISNAMLLTAVLEFSRRDCEERLADIGRVVLSDTVGLSTRAICEELISFIKQLCVDLDIPNLHTWGIEADSFERSLEKMADDALASGSPANNPRVPTKEEVIDLYRICYTYDFAKENYPETTE